MSPNHMVTNKNSRQSGRHRVITRWRVKMAYAAWAASLWVRYNCHSCFYSQGNVLQAVVLFWDGSLWSISPKRRFRSHLVTGPPFPKLNHFFTGLARKNAIWGLTRFNPSLLWFHVFWIDDLKNDSDLQASAFATFTRLDSLLAWHLSWLGKELTIPATG